MDHTFRRTPPRTHRACLGPAAIRPLFAMLEGHRSGPDTVAVGAPVPTHELGFLCVLFHSFTARCPSGRSTIPAWGSTNSAGGEAATARGQGQLQ